MIDMYASTAHLYCFVLLKNQSDSVIFICCLFLMLTIMWYSAIWYVFFFTNIHVNFYVLKNFDWVRLLKFHVLLYIYFIFINWAISDL